MATPLGGTPIQDMPPKGGFKPINYKRAIPNNGPGPIVLFGGALLAVTYGFYCIGQNNVRNSKNASEQRLARSNIVSFLQAEEDKRYVKWLENDLKEEKEIMSNVRGWKAGQSVYQGKDGKVRWAPPANNNPNLA